MYMNPTINPQATGLQVFYNENENVSIRTEMKDGEPWFVAKDMAMALNITWSGHTLDNIPEKWQGMVNLTTPCGDYQGGGLQSLKVINESAMYKLAFRSNKPKADRFVNWQGCVSPHLSEREGHIVASELGVSYSHVRKVYLGTSVSECVARALTQVAMSNKRRGVRYEKLKPTYEQLSLEWDNEEVE